MPRAGRLDPATQPALLACLFGLEVCLSATELAFPAAGRMVKDALAPTVCTKDDSQANTLHPDEDRFCTIAGAGSTASKGGDAPASNGCPACSSLSHCRVWAGVGWPPGFEPLLQGRR